MKALKVNNRTLNVNNSVYDQKVKRKRQSPQTFN